MPGQTVGSAAGVVGGNQVPSMEGRAIARPNRRGSHGQDRQSHQPSMEGRAIARPNFIAYIEAIWSKDPSMEGRAIARPNYHSTFPVNGLSFYLQWRAGQLPGQTRARPAAL